MKGPQLDLTVVLITKNEAHCIEKSIRSASFAGEVVVVDSGSTDETCQIARDLGARVVFNPWPGDFSAQRNWADGQAERGWVLQLDADEVISPELASELVAFFEKGRDGEFFAGKFPRQELIFGKWIKHGGWYPQYKLRFYRKGCGKWTGKVHERFETEGQVFTFSAPLLHDSYRDIHTFIRKFNDYSSIDAEEEYREKARFSLFKLIFQPMERFMGRFFLEKGYKDGFHGFVLAALIGLNYFLRHLKIWEKSYQDK